MFLNVFLKNLDVACFIFRPYFPAARIQEFETHEFFAESQQSGTRRLQDSEIHLWDVSGDRK